MASRRAAVPKRPEEQKAPPPTSDQPVVIERMSDALATKLFSDIETLLNLLGVYPHLLQGLPDVGNLGPTMWDGLTEEQVERKAKLGLAVLYIEGQINPDLRLTHMVLLDPNDSEGLEAWMNKSRELPPLRFAVPDPTSGEPKIHFFPRADKVAEGAVAQIAHIKNYLGPLWAPHLREFVVQVAKIWAKPLQERVWKDFPDPTFEFFPISPTQTLPKIEAPEAKTDDRKMADSGDKIFIHDGVRYRSLPLAARLAQAPRQTLLNWIKNKTEFAGRPLQSYYLAPVDRYFVSEESIQRIANRFVKWPSQEPAGPVTIGQTKDRSGFLAMSDAARTIGVSPRTMWLWASQGKAPTDKPLDIIKCTTSDHFYVREKDAYALKKLIPRSGLQRGRRPQLSPQL